MPNFILIPGITVDNIPCAAVILFLLIRSGCEQVIRYVFFRRRYVSASTAFHQLPFQQQYLPLQLTQVSGMVLPQDSCG